MPAAVYIETHGGTGIGGSDDHAGVDIGRTYTETAPASSPEQFLEHVREGHAEPPAARAAPRSGRTPRLRWPLARSSVRARSTETGPVNPAAVLEIAERVVADGGERGGEAEANLGAGEATALLRAWLDSVDLPTDPRGADRR